MKLRKIIAGIAGTAMMVPMMGMPVMATSDNGVAINATNFPDDNFRQYVLDEIDTDGNGKLSEDERDVEVIHVENQGIRSLEGIEFLDVACLYCCNNQLTSLDISKNKELYGLNCMGNQLTSLDFSNCTNLIWIACEKNNITNLNIDGCINLETLVCYDNSIENLDLSSAVSLRQLCCQNNNISELDVSNCPYLAISCNTAVILPDESGTTAVATSDIESFTFGGDESALPVWLTYSFHSPYACFDLEVEVIYPDMPDIVEINEKNFPGAGFREYISSIADTNHDGCLDLGERAEVTSIEDIYDDEFYEIDDITGIDNFPLLSHIDLVGSCLNVESLDITNFMLIRGVFINYSDINKLTISNCPILVNVTCEHNGLSELIIDNCPNLALLNCSFNNIDSVDISNTVLEETLAQVSDEDVVFAPNIDENMNVLGDELQIRIIVWEEDEMADVRFLRFGCDVETTLNTSNGVKKFEMPDSFIEYLNTYFPDYLGSLGNSCDDVSGVSSFAERLYTCALGRASEEAGKDYWSDALSHGTSGADAAYGFLFSEEVTNANLSDAAFVNRIYATLMDREPAAEETAYWVGCIEDGTMTREDVFLGFVNSTEWANVCVTYGILSGGTGVPSITVEPSQAILDFATRLYTTCLNREADQAGLEWWAGELANLRTTGSAAAQSYFFSDEFVNSNVNDREFVNRLYLTFMNRDAADAEFDYWLGEMGNGMTRETVFGGFALSEEFGNICAEYGIIR